MEEHNEQIDLKEEDATDKTKWRNAVNELSRNMK